MDMPLAERTWLKGKTLTLLGFTQPSKLNETDNCQNFTDSSMPSLTAAP